MSRYAPERKRRRLYRGTGCLMLAAGIAGGVAGSASAQTTPSAQPIAEPVVGQVFAQPIAEPVVGQVLVTSPLSTTVVDNQPRFTLVPSVRAVYDTNVLRHVDLDGGSRNNVRVTPGIDLDYRRLFGRVALGVSGSAGYDFNSRFGFLDQSRIDFNGSARAPVGAICSVKAEASYDRFRFDFDDTQAAGATSTTQVYSATASCERGAGFSPVVGITYRTLDNSRASYFNYEQYLGNLGIAYAQPSVGTVTLNATVAQLRRPDIAELTGFEDDTDVYSLSLGLDRSVSPRVRIRAAAGVTKADPQRASVPSFFGASYSGQVEWLPNPRFTVAGTAVRQVTNQNGFSATYVIREDYTLAAGLKVSAKSRISLTGNHTQREFRGDDLIPSLLPIRADRSNAVLANYSYDLSRRLRVGITLGHRWRNADNPVYNYKSTVLSSSIGAHF